MLSYGQIREFAATHLHQDSDETTEPLTTLLLRWVRVQQQARRRSLPEESDWASCVPSSTLGLRLAVARLGAFAACRRLTTAPDEGALRPFFPSVTSPPSVH